MNQADDVVAGNIVRLLDDGNDRLDPALRERLLTARKAALAQYRAQPQPVRGLVRAGGPVSRFIEDHPRAGYLVAGIALMIALAGVAYWPKSNGTGEFWEIDVGLLTDELPINAYLDKGFDSWLKRSSR